MPHAGEPIRAELDSIISRIERSSPAISEGQSAVVKSNTAAAGAWKLLYASNGTLNHSNLAAALLHVVELVPSLGIGRVSQEIYACPGRKGTMRMENSIVVSLGMLCASTHSCLHASCCVVYQLCHCLVCSCMLGPHLSRVNQPQHMYSRWVSSSVLCIYCYYTTHSTMYIS